MKGGSANPGEGQARALDVSGGCPDEQPRLLRSCPFGGLSITALDDASHDASHAGSYDAACHTTPPRPRAPFAQHAHVVQTGLHNSRSPETPTNRPKVRRITTAKTGVVSRFCRGKSRSISHTYIPSLRQD